MSEYKLTERDLSWARRESHKLAAMPEDTRQSAIQAMLLATRKGAIERSQALPDPDEILRRFLIEENAKPSDAP